MICEIKVKFKKLHRNATCPFKRKGDAGYDLFSVENTVLGPGEFKLIKTGIALEIPEFYYGKICPRSGLALKNGISVMAGTVDSTYRGDVGVILYNGLLIGSDLNQRAEYLQPNPNCFRVNSGDKIAQIIFRRYFDADFEEVQELSSSERGFGGFGSTGMR